jgi:ABC-type transport system involved in multi-copper enzyme maturation permease subunit
VKDALRYEWVRLRTLRSTWWLTVLTIGLSAVLGLVALGIKNVNIVDYGDLLTGGQGFFDFVLAVLLGMIGVFATGHEYRYGTMRPTLSAIPRRSVLMLAKVLVVTGYVAVVAVLAHVVRYLVALLILGTPLTDLGLFPGPMGRVWFGVCIYMVVYALVGLAFAALFRNLPAALVTLILLPFPGEPIIRGLLSIPAFSSIKGFAKILPFSAGNQIFSYVPADSTAPAGFRELPSPYVGLAIFLGFLGIVLGLAWILFERRDA